MKRLIWLAVLLLVLCGCGRQNQDATTAPTQPHGAAEQPTEPTGCYLADTGVEVQTGGAIRSYYPNIPDCYHLLTVGADVLVFSGTENTTLTRLAGDTLYTIAQAELNCLLPSGDSSFQISSNGITYYDDTSREVVFLDHDLKEVSRLAMPEKMVGKPVLSANRLKVYYCTEDAVRVVDLEAGLDKLLKSVSYPSQSVTDLLLNDTVIQCTIRDEHSLEYSVFLSAETGELLRSVEHGLSLTVSNGRYYASRQEGIMTSLFFGDADGETQMLIPEDPFGEVWYLASENAAIALSVQETAVDVAYYDLATGRRTAAAVLPGGAALWSVEPDGGSGYVYLMGSEDRSGQTVIWRWEPSASACRDDTVYTGPYRTAEAFDETGMAVCMEYAAAIGEKHGIQILVGPDAVSDTPWNYRLEMEYQVPVIMRELEKLERALSVFPEGFFEKLYGNEKIRLVRNITGSAESGSLDASTGIQYWNGYHSYVVLMAGEALEGSFYHEIFHLIDNRVLSNTRAYYKWDDLNPDGFVYDEAFGSNLPEEMCVYLEEATRAFISARAMTYESEDRAAIMEYACMPGNEVYFTSETMQAKLETLCKGIRESFGLKNHTEPFLWEQYLEEPLTP